MFEGVDEFVDAGEVLVLTSDEGTWLALTRTATEAGFEYLEPRASTGSIQAPASVPPGLVVDVPGMDFPGFASVPVPPVTPLGEIRPGRASFDGGSLTGAFSWDATPGSTALVRFDFAVLDGAFDGADLFAGTAPTSGSEVICLTADDGEFALPADALEAIGGAEGKGFVVMVTRETRHVARGGDALLLTSQRSEGD